MIIVQVVRTTWTKASRGQPGAGARAAVHDGFRIEGNPTDVRRTGGVIVETVRADEAVAFATTRHDEPVDGLPVRIANLVIELADGVVTVHRRPETSTGWPKRPAGGVSFRLAVGEWGRLLRNHRFSSYSGWSYEKTAVNIAHVATLDRRLFIAGPPDHLRDEQASLF